DTNNASISAKQIVIGSVASPDLTVTTVTAPSSGQPGQSIEMDWSGANAGSVDASGDWVDRVLLSPGGGILAAITHQGELAAGGHYDAKAQVALPDVADGSYQIVVETDATDSVSEGSNEGNNQNSASPPLQLAHPDLLPSITSSPDNAVAGATI